MTQPQPESAAGRYWTSARIAVAALLGVLVAAALGYAGFHFGAGPAPSVPSITLSAAGPGDCVTQKDVPAGQGPARLVACAAADAQYEVIRVLPAGSSQSGCDDVPGSAFALVQRPTAGGPGAVLCVEPVRVQARGPGE